jgi:hypothetical protein
MKTGLLALLLVAQLSAFQGLPRCTAVDPDTAKVGDTVNITCENVGKAAFAGLYLTDGENDTKIAVKEQTAVKITFLVPTIKPGRYHLAFLSANKANMVEQPIVLTVQ